MAEGRRVSACWNGARVRRSSGWRRPGRRRRSAAATPPAFRRSRSGGRAVLVPAGSAGRPRRLGGSTRTCGRPCLGSGDAGGSETACAPRRGARALLVAPRPLSEGRGWIWRRRSARNRTGRSGERLVYTAPWQMLPGHGPRTRKPHLTDGLAGCRAGRRALRGLCAALSRCSGRRAGRTTPARAATSTRPSPPPSEWRTPGWRGS